MKTTLLTLLTILLTLHTTHTQAQTPTTILGAPTTILGNTEPRTNAPTTILGTATTIPQNPKQINQKVKSTPTYTYDFPPGKPKQTPSLTDNQIWTYKGTNLAQHLLNTHGINPKGYTNAEMIILHSNAHNSEKTSRTRIRRR